MDYRTRSQRDSGAELRGLPNLDAPKRIGLLLISGFALPEAVAVLEMFQSANTLSPPEHAGGGIRYEVALLSIAGGRIESSSSVVVWTESVESRRLVDGFHMLFVAGGAGAHHALRDERLICWLRHEGPRCDAVVSIGDGRLLLDAAGVERSSHGWDAFLGRAGEPYRVAEGAFAAVATAPVRKALALIGQDVGGEFAREAVGREASPQQQTSIAGTIPENLSIIVSERILASAKWLEANGARPITIDDAA